MIKYCTKTYREQDGKTYFTDIFNNKLSITCFNPNKPIFKVDVREALPEEETPYVGWMTPDGNIDFIFAHRTLLEVCFPYGTKAEIEAGNGKVIRVAIKET